MNDIELPKLTSEYDLWNQIGKRKKVYAHPIVAKHPWSSAEKLFLLTIHCADTLISNRVLARQCSVQFGRVINENAIRGALTRLRADGSVPMRRPPKPPKIRQARQAKTLALLEAAD